MNVDISLKMWRFRVLEEEEVVGKRGKKIKYSFSSKI